MIRCEVFLCVDGAAAGANGGDSALHGAMFSLSSVCCSWCQHVLTLAIAGQGVKMIVVSSGQLTGTTSRPVMMSLPGGQAAGVKTVSVRGGGVAAGQQILTLPGGGQQTQTMMIGGKPVTVLTSGAQQLGGKTVQLVSQGGGGQPMVVMQGGQRQPAEAATPVTSNAALPQLAADAGLLEVNTAVAAGGEGEQIQMEAGGDLSGGQLDGGYVTPQDGVSEIGDPMDIQQYLDMFQTQVDGDPGELEAGDTEAEQMETSAAEDTSEVTAAAGEAAAEDEAAAPAVSLIHSTLGSAEPAATEEESSAAAAEEPAESEPTPAAAEETQPEPEPEKQSVEVPEVSEDLQTTVTTAETTATTVTEPVESVVSDVGDLAADLAAAVETETPAVETETESAIVETLATAEEAAVESVEEEKQESAPEVEQPQVTAEVEEAIKEEKPLLADQADFDGASALAALASVATLPAATAAVVTAVTSPAATPTAVKKEEAGLVSSALSLPVTSAKQDTSLKSELDEVRKQLYRSQSHS